MYSLVSVRRIAVMLARIICEEHMAAYLDEIRLGREPGLVTPGKILAVQIRYIVKISERQPNTMWFRALPASKSVQAVPDICAHGMEAGEGHLVVRVELEDEGDDLDGAT